MTPIAVRIDVSELLPAEVTAAARIEIAAHGLPDALHTDNYGREFHSAAFRRRLQGSR
jgi:hypothetical protein